MALILHLETATTVCSVALSKDGNLIALKEQDGDYSHAENLTLFIEDVFKQAQLPLHAVDAIAVSKGPGSYTGLRIGVSTAKGLCYSLNKPLIAINTLQSMALGVIANHAAKADALFCPMIDARRMEVYCAIYNAKGEEIKATAAEIIEEHSFADLLTKHAIYFFGDGAAKCQETFSTSPNAHFIADGKPSAKDMIASATAAFRNNQFEDVAYFEPFYLKDFVAGKKKGDQ